MTTKNIITCDKCGNQELTTAAGIWLHVDPRASTKTLVGLTYDQKVAMLNTRCTFSQFLPVCSAEIGGEEA